MAFRCFVCLLTWMLAALARAEVPPAESLPCFPGAYYRKAVSSQDVWTGIEAVVTLPSFEADTTRTHPSTGRPLDNPSVYVGGLASGQEIDAGVSWEVVKLPDGSISKMPMAYRPFWRNEKWYSGPAKPDFYYYPGDKIRMRVETREIGKLQLSIELVERGDTGRRADLEMRGDHAAETTAPQLLTMIPADAHTSLTVNFEAPGFGPGQLQEFKRVNAIDQRGKEGADVEPTKTCVREAIWHEVWLLREDKRLPMSSPRFTDMRCPAPKHVTAHCFNESGERVTLRGTPPRDPVTD